MHAQKTIIVCIEAHTSVYRPWGSYEVLGEGSGYKMKKIVVKPGKRLSLQKHFKRNEHWVVVEGEALVTIDGNQMPLRQNESIYIKKEQIHRLENTASTDLIIIEVQTGEYLGEDDIVRISDDYDRM